METGKADKQEKDLRRAFIGDMTDIVSRFLPGDIFGGTPRPGKIILDDVLTLSKEAHEKESENSRIAPLLFTMGGGEPLWFVGDSPKRVLNDFKPERDNAICKGIVPEGKTPADGLLKRLGYAHRVYTFAMNIDGRRTNNDYVSATIDVDVDIPLFTPVDEYRKTGKQGKLDQLIRQAVLGKKGRRWLVSVKNAIDDLVESGKIEETPYWKLKKAFMYFSKNFSLIPVVEVDPVSLKAHFTLYTAYMPMKVHQELTRIISETFFKGMYDEALTADNRMLALSRVGSMSKSDGLEGKFLYRRFLWFGCQDQKTLATLLQFIRLGLFTPKLTDQQLSSIRSLAMENGVQVNRGCEHQYKAVRFASLHHPDNMATDEIDAYSMYAWAATKSVPYSFSMIKGIGDDLANAARFGLRRAENLFGKRTWICAPLKNFADCDDAKLLGLNISFGEGSGWDPGSIEETRQKPLLHTWNQITVNHLVDYNEENEPTEDDENDAKPRRDNDDRPVRRRRPRRIVGDESPAPVNAKDNEDEDGERPVRRRRRPRRVPEEDRCLNCGEIHTPPDTDNEEELARWRRDFAARHGFEYEEFDPARSRLVDECIESDPRSPEHYGPAGHPELAAAESALDAFEGLDVREEGTCVFTFRGGRTYTRRVARDENGRLTVIADDADKEEDTTNDINEEPVRPVRRRRRRAPEAIEAPVPAPAAVDAEAPTAAVAEERDEDERPVADASADFPSVAAIMAIDDEKVREEHLDRLRRDLSRKKEEALTASGTAKAEIEAEVDKLHAVIHGVDMAEVDLLMDEWTVDPADPSEEDRIQRKIMLASLNDTADDTQNYEAPSLRRRRLDAQRKNAWRQRKNRRERPLKPSASAPDSNTNDTGNDQDNKRSDFRISKDKLERLRGLANNSPIEGQDNKRSGANSPKSPDYAPKPFDVGFNAKGHRVGVEALYLMMAKGQSCRFGGFFGDPARVAGLMALLYIASNKKSRITNDRPFFHPFSHKPQCLSYEQYENVINSITSTIENMGYDVLDWSAKMLAAVILDTALNGMGRYVRELAIDIATNPNLNEEWMFYFEIGLRQMEHSIVSDEFADPYAVRMRHLKIRMPNGKTLDPLSNVRLKGNGKVSPWEFVDLAGAVLNFDVAPLHKLPEKAAMNSVLRAMAERPEIHYKKRDLRENSVYVSKLMEAAEKGFRPGRTPEEYAQNTAEFRHRRMDAIRRSGFVLEDQPITPEQAWEIVKAAKGDAYDSATESFTAITSLTKGMLGDKDHKYDNIYEIGDDIVRSDGHWTDGGMALLKSLLAVHVETLSRLGKVNLLGSSRGIDFSAEFGRDWSDPEAMKTPWDGKLLAKEFAYITREMSLTSHDDVIAQDKENAELAFSKNHHEKEKEQWQVFEHGTPNFLLPRDIDVTPYSSIKADREAKLFRTDFIMTHGSVVRPGSAAYEDACRIFEPTYTFRYRSGGEEKMGMYQFEQEFNLDDILKGKIYMAPNFSRGFGYDEASGEIDQLPCPSSPFLKTEKDEEGSSTTKSIAGTHYIPKKTFTAAALLLATMQNKRRISFDRTIKGLHAFDMIFAAHEYDGKTSIPISARYLSMKSGISHNECNSIINDLAAIGFIDRVGGELRGTLLGPAETEKELAAQELCERVGPGIIGQERATGQSFVESGQFISTYTKFHADRFVAERDGELSYFTADEIIEGFKNLDGVTDSYNPFMMVIESALRILDAKVDRLRDFSEDSLRKSNLFEVRMDYVLSKVEHLTTDQYRSKASVVRNSIIRCLSYVAPSEIGCLTDVEDTFRHTSKLYKGRTPELMRTYGYWLSRLMGSKVTMFVPESQIKREFNSVIRFLSGRGGMVSNLLDQISNFVSNIRQVEIASRSWNAYAADLAAAAREFRRSYLALLGAVSKAAKAPYSGDFDISSLVSNGTPIKRSS